MDTVFRKPNGNRFSDTDLAQILESTFVERIDFHRVIDSTNDRALELARQSTAAAPQLVLADSQTSGRGRGTNSWWAAQGALTFTVLLKPDLPPRRLPQASLTTGLAVCEAMEEVIDQPGFQLKWPNDVYLQQRKLCGILIELPPGKDRLMAIGIGINVNNSMREAPPDLQSSAISLCDATQCELSLTHVLICLLEKLENRLDWIGRHNGELWAKWRERCLLTNRTIRLEMGVRKVDGVCRGIDEEGALLIDTRDGTERCFAGAITQF